MLVLQIPIVTPQSLAFAVLVFGIGVFGFFTQVFLTMGLQRETAGRGSLGLYVQILFAAIAEHWIFHAAPSSLSLIGIFIILICAGYVAVCSNSSGVCVSRLLTA
jgi:drug/metabolite transporter (DMT)-like permease